MDALRVGIPSPGAAAFLPAAVFLAVRAVGVAVLGLMLLGYLGYVGWRTGTPTGWFDIQRTGWARSSTGARRWCGSSSGP